MTIETLSKMTEKKYLSKFKRWKHDFKNKKIKKSEDGPWIWLI